MYCNLAILAPTPLFQNMLLEPSCFHFKYTPRNLHFLVGAVIHNYPMAIYYRISFSELSVTMCCESRLEHWPHLNQTYIRYVITVTPRHTEATFDCTRGRCRLPSSFFCLVTQRNEEHRVTRQKRLHERLEGGGDCAWNLHKKEMISPLHIFLLFSPSSLRPSIPRYLFPLFC